MVRALTEYDVRGISTTIGFCRDLIASPEFAAADFDTTYVDRVLEENGRKAARSDELEEIAAIAAAMWEMARRPSPIFDGAPSLDSRPSSIHDRRSTMDDRRSLWARRARLESLR